MPSSDSLPAVTPEAVRAMAAARADDWRAARPAARPFTFRWPADPGDLLRSSHLVDRLRRVADRITDRHWFRRFVLDPESVLAGQADWDPRVPTYRPWSAMTDERQIEFDARQELWQRDVADNMPALALAARVFGDEKYVTALKAHVLAACAYPTWGDALDGRNRDLACAHLARGIAIARDWLPDAWTADELATIHECLDRRLTELLAGFYGNVYWHGHWPDNHCQIGVAALGICGAVFLDEMPAAAEWLAAAETGLAHVAAAGNADGSSAEGVSYWSYGMSFLLQYLEAAYDITDAARFYDADYFRHAFAYRLQSSTPALGGTLPFGDAVPHDYYGPAHLLRALGRHYRDPHAQWLADRIPFDQTGGADCDAWDLLWNDPALEPVAPTLDLDAHLPDWDVAVSRSGWDPGDTLVAVKGGYTNRSHSHLDAGAIVLARGDEWLLTASGYGTVGPGFWDFRPDGGRWDYFSNATESHTTLLVDGRNQRSDRDARATIGPIEVAADGTRTVIDLTGAYDGVRSVRREIVHRRGESVLVRDDVELLQPGTVEWLLQPGGTVTCVDGRVTAAGTRGRLEARMLWPALPFTRRAPTRPHLDVPGERVRTHSVAQQGTVVTFVCLITFLDA